MREYFVFVSALCVIVSVLSLLAYGKDNSNTARAAMGIILVCAISLPPIRAVLALADVDVGGFFEEFDSGDGGVSLGTTLGEPFADGVKKLVCQRYSIDEDEVRVHVFGLDAANMRAERIVVVLRGRAVLSDLRGIRSAVEDAGLGKCEVKIEAS